jgi:outer membrane protein assembly factor BamB
MSPQTQWNAAAWACLPLCFTLAVGRFDLCAGDWPQYRGPTHDGVSTDAIRLDWSEEAPRLLWKVTLEPGLSSFSVGGGRAFTQVRRPHQGTEQEWCVALDADSGRELWAVPLDLADYPDGGVGSDDGPRSTPTLDGDRVYVFTSYLRLVCLEAATGHEVWRRDFVAELGSGVVRWQNAASPLLVGDLIFVNCNARGARLAALRKQDGSIAWRRHDDRMTQATPIAAMLAGVPQIVFFAQSGLVSVVPETGALNWRFPFPYSTSTAASPVVGSDKVYCSAAYGSGAGVAQITKNGAALAATELWTTPGANMNHWSTPVHHKGFIYGTYGQGNSGPLSVQLRCLDLATGEEKWRHTGHGRGGLLLVADHLLVLAEDGQVVLVKPDPAAYTEVARFRAVTGKCWNVPAIANGRLYARSTRQAAAYDLAPKVLPPLAVKPTLSTAGGKFTLTITTADGSPLDAGRAGTINILTTEDLLAPPASWSDVSATAELVDGRLHFEDPQGAAAPQRFYWVQERR